MKICECGARFKPKCKNQIFCCPGCRKSYYKSDHGRWFTWAREREKKQLPIVSFKKFQYLQHTSCSICGFGDPVQPRFNKDRGDWYSICGDCFSFLRNARDREHLERVQAKIRAILSQKILQ